MKALFVCHRFPFPPDFGSKVRAFHTIKHLGKKYDVTVASIVRSEDEAKAGEGIAPHCHNFLMETISPGGALARMILGAPTLEPASMAYFYSPALKRRIRAEVEKTGFDLIVVHSSSAAQYVEDIDDIPKILDFADMDSQKWLDYARFHRLPRSLVYWIEGVKLRREEARLARLFDSCTCTTPAEIETLQDYDTGTYADWFVNGVDLDYFSPDDTPCDPESVVFTGRMDYFPNVQAMQEFCANVLWRIRARRPDATLTIVGANPTRAVRELAKLPGVTVTGTVPDVRPFVRKATVSVAPLQIARGTQNKILESLAMGVPVVTSEVAAKGIDAVAGEHILTATGPEDFATQVLRLLDDPAERRHFAEAGRARVVSHHSWPASMARLDQIIETCVRGAREVAPAGTLRPERMKI